MEKKLTTALIIACGLLGISCEKYPKYWISTQSVVPDSLKDQQAQFIIEVVKSASYNMTAGDYEDPEDVIEQANETFVEIYSVRVNHLIELPCHGCYQIQTPFDKLTQEQLKIYNSIR